jgi:hypothetical protein
MVFMVVSLLVAVAGRWRVAVADRRAAMMTIEPAGM